MPGRARSAPAPPFAHLNLRWNPFRALSAAETAELARTAVDAPALADRLRRPGFAVQFTGRRGTGKTTHLHALRAHFPRAPYVYFAVDRLPPVPRAGLLFLDELQRMPRRRRARLFRRGARPLRRRASLVIASHQDHTDDLRRAGFEVSAVELSAPTPERLCALLNGRIEWARRGPGPVPRIRRAAAARLLERSGGNVRTVQDQLYETFQTLREPCDVEV